MQKIAVVSAAERLRNAAVLRPSSTVAVAPIEQLPPAPVERRSTLGTGRPHTPPLSAQVFVSQRAFRRWWVAIVGIHCLCGTFLCYAGLLYRYLKGSSVLVDFTTYSITVDSKYFGAIAAMYFSLAGVHGLLILHLIARSVRARKLVFHKPKPMASASASPPQRPTSNTSSPRTASLTSENAAPLASKTSIWKYVQCRLPQWTAHAWAYVHPLLDVFDVRHKNFGLVFLVREIVMTFIQSVQTYRLSCLASRLWMNHVMASLLILNSWATPLLEYVYRSKVGHVRLGNAIVNLLLDMVSYIVLPTALLVPYVAPFNQDLKNFDRVHWFIDAWLINLINEVQLVLVNSLFDAISKCIIALSVARGLYSTTKLLYTADAVVPVECIVEPRDPTAAPTAATSADSEPPSTRTSSLAATELSRPRTLRWRAKIEAAGRHLLFVWGLIVLIAHTYASWLPAYPQCRLPTRPWFGTKPSCSLLEINCAAERTTGSEADIDSVLHHFDPNRIEYLVIRNCPLLQFPPRTQTLRQLFGLKLVSSTILDWDEDAALTSTHHPTLRFLFVIDVKMRELPIGLRCPDFPRSLRDIEFSRTNLSTLPEDLDTIWPPGMLLSFEECQLQEIPPVVLRMRPQDLYLALNNITRVPHELLEELPVRLLLLDGNPLTTDSFPTTLSTPPHVTLFGLARTNLTALPTWMDASVLATSYVVLGETPLCDHLLAAGEATKDDFRTLMGIPGVDCTLAFLASGTLNWYPIDDEPIVNPTYTLLNEMRNDLQTLRDDTSH